MPRKSTTSADIWLGVIVGIAIAATLLAITAFFVIEPKASGGWSEIGDYYGGVLGPAFSLLALLAVALTLRQQVRESDRNEDRESRLAFETHFFHLLHLHQFNVDSMTLSEGKSEKGRDCLRYLHDELAQIYKDTHDSRNKNCRQQILVAYNKFNRAYQRDCGHFIRHLFSTLNFLRRAHQDGRASLGVNKIEDYLRLLRAQLSESELVLLFYLVIGYEEKKRDGPRDPSRFRKLIEGSGFFKNLTPDMLFDREHWSFFTNGAYADGPVFVPQD